MHRQIKESDWRVLRELKPIALNRLCDNILSEIAYVSGDKSKNSHERYIEIFKLIQRRDDDIARAFNDLSRSNALERLAAMRLLNLVTDSEFASFSDETQGIVRLFTGQDDV